MSLLRKLFGKKKMKNATITLVGPSQSGKTTFVRYIETGEPVLKDMHTTLGMEIRREAVAVGSWKLNAIDTGGQQIYQQTFWEVAIHQADAVVFMLDATVRDGDKLYAVAQEQFAYALEIATEDMPLLVLLNKQDLKEKNPMNAEDAFKIFNTSLFGNRSIAYLPISAKYGDGVEEALKWLVQKLEELDR